MQKDQLNNSSEAPVQNNDNPSLVQEALRYFNNGISVLLMDRQTQLSVSREHNEDNPLPDEETIKRLCEVYPEANLAIVVGAKESDLVAIYAGDDEWCTTPRAALEELIKEHGLPETLAFTQPDEKHCYLFRPPSKDPSFKKACGFIYDDSAHALLVPPSVIKGEAIRRIGETTARPLDEWLGSKPAPEPTSLIADKDTPDSTPAKETSKANEVEQTATKSDTEDDVKIAESEDSPDDFIRDLIQRDTKLKPTLTEAAQHCLAHRLDFDKMALIKKVIDIAVEVRFEDTLLHPDVCRMLVLSDFEMFAFKDEHSHPHITLHETGKNVPLDDPTFKKTLAYQFYKIFKKFPCPTLTKQAFTILDIQTQMEGETFSLSNRIASNKGAFYFDMGNANAVEMQNDSWSIIQSPTLFRHFGHQNTQVEPIKNGDVWQLFDYLNVKEEDQLLLMVYIISLFIPDIPHPILHVWGEHGAAKSFLCTAINQLCDPTSTQKLIVTKNEKDLVLNLYKHYVCVFDNLSAISQQESDMFCLACTGGTLSKRKLYTDSEDIIYRIKHCIIINSLEMLLMKQDLLDRSIILHMERIPKERRKVESEVLEGFESARPHILGGIFDCIVKARSIFPKVPTTDLPRMADFFKWGYAITEALGYEGDDFIKAIAKNTQKQNEGVLSHNTLCQAIIDLMEERESYESMVGTTLDTLKGIARPSNQDDTFPKAPKDLAGHLAQIRPTLSEYGISYAIGKRTGKGTPISFEKTQDSASSATSASPPARSKIAHLVPPGEPNEANEPDNFDLEDLGLDMEDLFGKSDTEEVSNG